jgi:hypothetical protein
MAIAEFLSCISAEGFKALGVVQSMLGLETDQHEDLKVG